MWIAIGTMLVCSGCFEERRLRCAQAYDHLVDLAKTYPQRSQRSSFIDACGTAWDEPHVRCLMAADTVEQALACKPSRARPG